MLTKIEQKIVNSGVPKFTIIETLNGGNNKIYKADINDQKYCIKLFDEKDNRAAKRFIRELEALQILNANRVSNVPEIYKFDKDELVIIMKWIEGNRPTSSLNCLNSIIDFIGELNVIYKLNSYENIADDALLNENSINLQIIERDKNLRSSSQQYQTKIVQTENLINNMIKFDNYDLKFEIYKKTLSPSDIGVHNMLEKNNNYYFLDFEYFGIDSIYKLIGDFLLHPNNKFTIEHNTFFLSHLCERFDLKKEVLGVVMYKLSIKWMLILFGRHNRFNENNGSKKNMYLEAAERYLILAANFEKDLINVDLSTILGTLRTI